LYASYAALDGPHGVDNPCASLGKPVASLLGGVCLNVDHKGNTGEALLVLQVVWASLALIVNGSAAFYSMPVEVPLTEVKAKAPPYSALAQANTIDANIKSNADSANRRNRPLKSIYYKEMSN
tara:strand:+ start:311 stop:679 length:369 start_codon:yes stop_codon:yes gene_type:complete